jgi:hypothetical protein
MDISNFISIFPQEVRESPAMNGLVILIQTLQEQLQKTQEQLTKAQDKIKVLEDELAKLRKTPKRPKFRSNGMQPRNRDKPSSYDPPLAIDASLIQKEISEIKITVPNPPEGSRFKGYQSFSIQDIILTAKEPTFKLEVWETPSGEIIRASLSEELKGGHYGPTLCALIINLYDKGVTQPAIYEFIRKLGIELSTAQVNNILMKRAEGFSSTHQALDHPRLPLHNNDSERDIRGVAKRRNISESTKSTLGRKFRDGLFSLQIYNKFILRCLWQHLQCFPLQEVFR